MAHLKFPMRPVAVAALLLAPLPALAEIVIHDAYARASRPGAPTGAAFMIIENTGPEADRLIAARTDAAHRAELHSHVDQGNGVMSMVEIEGGIAIAAGESHALARGGDHVMLIGLTGTFEQGGAVVLTLTFEAAGEIEITVPVDNAR
jgi:copper(I)-binding protein